MRVKQTLKSFWRRNVKPWPSSRQFPARVALIIDDIGYSVPLARQFLRLGIPVTFSILPRLSKSEDLAVEIRYRGHEIMLHQPILTACRNIFLDNVLDESAILMQLYKLEQHALGFGRAIGIGHPFPEKAGALARFLAGKSAPDISFVHVSRILSA